MDDTQLEQAAELFLEYKVRERHGWTFEQFVRGYQDGEVDHLMVGVA